MTIGEIVAWQDTIAETRKDRDRTLMAALAGAFKRGV